MSCSRPCKINIQAQGGRARWFLWAPLARSPERRLSKVFLLASALFFAVWAEAAPIEAVSLSEAADAFLRELNTPEPARRALKVGDSRALCVVEAGGSVYGFSAARASTDRDDDVKAELDAAEARFHVLRARRALVLHLTKGRVDRKVYPDEEALGGALLTKYVKYGAVAGSQSASETAGGWTMALVWLAPEAAEAVRDVPPKTGELDGDYCALLYERAKSLFDAGRYGEALPVFKHIHDFRCANVGAYTDAAECFLRTGEPGECVRLLKELTETLGGHMASDAFERAGRLFREAGDRAAAFSAFKTARERFREGK